MKKVFAVFLTIIACTVIVPIVFVVHVLIWWNLAVPFAAAVMSPYDIRERFVYNLSLPITNTVLAVFDTHKTMSQVVKGEKVLNAPD